MKLTSLLLASLATNGHAAVFDETEADYTVVVPAGQMHCYFQPMAKGLLRPVLDKIYGSWVLVKIQSTLKLKVTL